MVDPVAVDLFSAPVCVPVCCVDGILDVPLSEPEEPAGEVDVFDVFVEDDVAVSLELVPVVAAPSVGLLSLSCAACVVLVVVETPLLETVFVKVDPERLTGRLAKLYFRSRN